MRRPSVTGSLKQWNLILNRSHEGNLFHMGCFVNWATLT